jgi:acyl-CoA reductase-like NAD-dependent aldehyde dehydrogenase
MFVFIKKKMTTKQSIAKKKYWAGVSVEERAKRASKMAKGRWSKMSASERSEYCRKLINIRWKK